jgi:uncharacterized membrane protein
MSEDFPSGGPDSKITLSRFLRILLIVSLALNMFFLGAGAVLIGRHMGGPPDRPMGFFMKGRADFPGPGLMLRALPKETRERIEKEIAPEKAAMKAAMDASRQARRAAFAAFSAQPFSAETYRQKREAAEAADLATVRAVHAVLAKATAVMTPEERARLIDAMKSHRFGPSFKDSPDGPPQPPPPDGGPPPPD